MAEKDNQETVEIAGLGKGTWDAKNRKVVFSNDTVKTFAKEHGIDDYAEAQKRIAGVQLEAAKAVVPFLGDKVAADHEKASAVFGTGTGAFDVAVDAKRTRRNPKDPSQTWDTFDEVTMSVHAPKPKLDALADEIADKIKKSYEKQGK